MRLPPPYLGELVGSVLTRAVIHSGVPAKRLLVEVTGRRCSNLSFFLPSSLSGLAELMSVNAHELLWEHTAFPYVVAFMAPADVDRFATKALGQDLQQGSVASLIQSVTQGLPALRYCPDCVLDDVAELGESYWHRDHCLPATHVCRRHGTRLRLGDFATKIASRAYGMGLPQHQRGRPDFAGPPDPTAKALALGSYELLSRIDGHTADWSTHYRTLALEKGFVMVTGEVASAQLAMNLQVAFGEAYLASLGCSVTEPGRSWPALMVRERVRVPFAPVKHVLMQAFLDGCNVEQKTLAYRPPGKVPRDASSLDEQLAKQVRKAAIRANLRNVQTTITQLMKDTGHWSAFRHDRSNFPKTTAELAAFRATEASERKLGGREGHQRNMARKAAAAKR
ncbi:MAG TPA: TnsD family Tn7-like transposition protein [Ideonella sp.]|uniref:TnsD family Tn7-like transposition protein n=1 Tax=Ideonella sp. TaxID=1929293 RepID=UPI002BBCFF5F|nr:TnsD family Tn7-like transposition protein [Ideonella sp.]HSI49178.1 TnsD family Tn7-like transposition protein [Ideonella sp.]